MIWALEKDVHDKEAVSTGDCYREHACIKTDLPTCWTTSLLFSMEKMKHVPKLFLRGGGRAKMAKLISRFTNNEECPFWPLFLWSCHWRPGAILSGQNTSQDRRGRGREGGRQTERGRESSLFLCLCLSVRLKTIEKYRNTNSKVYKYTSIHSFHYIWLFTWVLIITKAFSLQQLHLTDKLTFLQYSHSKVNMSPVAERIIFDPCGRKHENTNKFLVVL